MLMPYFENRLYDITKEIVEKVVSNNKDVFGEQKTDKINEKIAH
jgi:hypothetical protein